MWQHIHSNELLPDEQVGCTPHRGGCAEQLLIDSMIMHDAHARRKNLAMAWLDVRKAYDSVSHTWLLDLLQLLKFHPAIQHCIQNLIASWKTQLIIPGPEARCLSDSILIKRGIFQGDSLSPLLFCLALIPISREIDRSGHGYACGPPERRIRISHLYYMDDLKLFSKSTDQLNSMINTAELIGQDFGLNLHPAKCAVFTLKRGRPDGTMPDITTFATDSLICHLDVDATYRYLGLAERGQFCEMTIKASVMQEYQRRLRLVLGSSLSAKRLMQALNAYAVPVILYSLPLLQWTKAEIQSMDRTTRRHLTLARVHHPRASTIRLYLPRKLGGRGLLSFDQLRQRSVIRLARFLHIHRTDTSMLEAVFAHQTALPASKSLIHRAASLLEDLDLTLDSATKAAVRIAISGRSLGHLQRRPLQGRFWQRMITSGVDQQLSLGWLHSPTLRPETEGFLVAAQEQMLSTRNFQAQVQKTLPATADVCRRCNGPSETIDHLLNCCPVLAKHAYVTRHNRLVRLLHWAICVYHGVAALRNPANHALVHTVMLPNGGSLLWEVSLPTDVAIPSNRPDLVLRHQEKAFLIDVAVPLESNLSAKMQEKVAKYQPLCLELQRIWELPSLPEVVPIVVGSLGGLLPDMEQTLVPLCGARLRVSLLQQQAILGSLAILRHVLQ